jgi:hypothetical protein
VGERTGWSRDLRVTADAVDVVAMVGVVGLRMLADRTGLTGVLSAVLAKPGFVPVHDRGRVLTDVACSIAAGGTDLYDIEALRANSEVFGPVASDTTALRGLSEIGDRDLYRIDERRAAARAHLWVLLPDGIPHHWPRRRPGWRRARRAVAVAPREPVQLRSVGADAR